MRNNTQRIYERLSRGEFLSVDSTEASIRHLYEDIEENFDDYADFFKEIGLQLIGYRGLLIVVYYTISTTTACLPAVQGMTFPSMG